MKTLSILFAGEMAPVTLVDGTAGRVFVRSLPQQFFGHVLQVAEHRHQLIELTTYFHAKPAKGKSDHPLDAAMRTEGAALFPDVDPPAGFVPVPAGWTQNLDDASIERLGALAEKLNFSRAATAARSQVSAKKFMAPLNAMAMEQVLPLVEQVLAPMLTRLERSFAGMRSAPPSSASPEPSSSPKTSSGLPS